MLRKITLIAVGSLLILNPVLSQDDNPWWKKLFKKETVTEIESDNQLENDSISIVEPLDSIEKSDSSHTEIDPDSAGFIFSKPELSSEPGSIQVFNDYPLDSLNEIYKERDNYGYRIQIYFGELSEAKSTRATFMNKRTSDNCYIELKAPNYAVLVGDYRDLFEAHQRLFKIRETYPDALIVESVIEP